MYLPSVLLTLASANFVNCFTPCANENMKLRSENAALKRQLSSLKVDCIVNKCNDGHVPDPAVCVKGRGYCDVNERGLGSVTWGRRDKFSGSFTQEDCKKIKSLRNNRFCYQQIESVPNYYFYDLHDLESLQLSNNKIKVVSKDLFKKNTKLSTLDLSTNELTNLDVDTFSTLTNLEILRLGSNKIEVIPEGLFKNNKKLTKLYLGYNNFKKLESAMFNKELTVLYLNTNKLTKLESDTFSYLTNLEELHLQYNQIEAIPKDFFKNNKKLTELNIAGNKLKKIEIDTFFPLINLEWLELQENQISVITKDMFKNNKKLEDLKAYDNKLNYGQSKQLERALEDTIPYLDV